MTTATTTTAVQPTLEFGFDFEKRREIADSNSYGTFWSPKQQIRITQGRGDERTNERTSRKVDEM